MTDHQPPEGGQQAPDTRPKAGNRMMMAALRAPILGPVLNRGLTILTYTGRRSGRTYRLPVGYRRRGDTVILQSKFGSEGKSWWRNFLGDGAPVTVLIGGTDRPGHAVAVPDGDQVTVTVALSPLTPA